MRALRARGMLLGALAAVIVVPTLAHSGVTVREQRIALVAPSSSALTKASNVECALRAPVQAVFGRFSGFAVRLSEDEVERVQTDPEIYAVLPDPGSWVARIDSRDPAVVEARIRELEHKLEFRSDHRYNNSTWRGFAAVLGWPQLARLSREPDVRVNPDPWVYIVFYVPGVDVDARTDELERRYGFRARFRYRGLGGFSATLTGAQLGGLAGESDIQMIGPDAYGWSEPSRAACVRTSPRLRRLLRAAFVRAHSTLAGRQLRGPYGVRIALSRSLEGATARYAIGSFSHPRLRPESQPEAFTFVRRWRDLGATNGVICTDGENAIPPGVPRTWFLRPAAEDPNCYRVR